MSRAARSLSTTRGGGTENDQLFAFVTAALFCGLSVLGATFHEFWRDEAHTWLVLSESRSPGDLIERLGFCGHPKTWYLLLYGLKKLIDHRALLAVANVASMSIAVFLLARAAPLSRYQKLLFCLGFFPLYQYGLVCRPYGLIVALLFAYCSVRPRLCESPIAAAILLACLASIHALSLILSGVLVVLAAFDCWRSKVRFRAGQLLPAVIIVLVGWVITAYQLIPPEGFPIQHTGARNPLFVFQGLASGFFPEFDFLHHHPAVQVTIGLLLWTVSWCCFVRQPIGLAYYASLSLALVAFMLFVYGGRRWHHGFFYISMIVAYWVAFSRVKPDRLAKAALTVILAFLAVWGVYAYASDLSRPSSGGKLAAKVIQTQGLDELPRVGLRILDNSRYRWEIDHIQSTLAYLSDPSIYDPISGSFVSYWKHYGKPFYFRRRRIEAVIEDLSSLTKRFEADILVIAARPKDRDRADLPAPFQKIEDIPSGFRYGENISLFLFPRGD
jgi:uncharacterized membrane protein YhdT